MPRVLNKETGRKWRVLPGHFSLSDDVYEVLPDEPEPEPAPVAEPEPEPAKKPVARKSRKE